MFLGTTGSSLTSSSHLLAATWENALKHFRRALLECGSPLDIEHSQRIGLLFSQPTGNTNELKRWASFFDAEAVPATALILKALVNHGQWQTAVKLLELNKESGVACELSEVLGQCLVARGLWQQTLKLADFLQLQHDVAPRGKSLALSNTLLLSTREHNDSHQMASNPAFLPEEERTTYCGFVSAVARAYPSKRDWKEALRILHDLEQLVDGETKRKLYEYRIARLVHDGQAYKNVIEKSQCELGFRTSPSLVRSLLHCAIATSDCSLTMNCLKLLCSFGPTAVSVRLFETACRLLVESDETWTKEDLVRFESVVCENAALVKDRKLQKLISAFCADYDLKTPIFLSSILMLASSSKTAVAPSLVNSITNLDRLASTLIYQSRWEEALHVATLIRNGAAKSDNERIIVDMLRGSCSSWVKTLQFFRSPRSKLIAITLLPQAKQPPKIATPSKDYIKVHEPITCTMSRNMIVNMSFNCPEIQILGPVQESTIERLNEVLPDSTTSTRSIRSNQPKFEYVSNPDHWRIKLDNQFCDSEGVSRLIVLLLDALEEEGGWTLISSQASSSSRGGVLQQDFVLNYKLFFSKYQDDE